MPYRDDDPLTSVMTVRLMIITNQFSGSGRALRLVCAYVSMCVCLDNNTFKQDDL